ncbi:Pectinesterase 31 [Platanthera guangdongensis]|uniref:pectinesterase n=1 Tax=Platanthera guangdongensis TaxID=2320717 RepID=A0ABR2MWR6_9ASPA
MYLSFQSVSSINKCRCVITGNGGSAYACLGRSWRPFGRVVFAYTWMGACIRPVGWHNWDKPENERSACFYEYRCFGPGSNPSTRVTWSRELLDEEAEHFLVTVLLILIHKGLG